MCRPTTCEIYGKITWRGCDKHIGSVKGKVPIDQWCDEDHSGEECAAVEEGCDFFGDFCG